MNIYSWLSYYSDRGAIAISFRDARKPVPGITMPVYRFRIATANSGISPKGFQIAAWPKRSRKWHTVLKIMGEITEFRVLDDRPRDWFHGADSQDPSDVRVGEARQKSHFSYLVRGTTGSNVAAASGHASHHQSRSICHHVL